MFVCMCFLKERKAETFDLLHCPIYDTSYSEIVLPAALQDCIIDNFSFICSPSSTKFRTCHSEPLLYGFSKALNSLLEELRIEDITNLGN